MAAAGCTSSSAVGLATHSMARTRGVTVPGQQPLFDLPAAKRLDKSKVKGVPPRPLWTENKARLIERYLYYFVLITKHRTYIDGFAGPQHSPENWAARLVLETE